MKIKNENIELDEEFIKSPFFYCECCGAEMPDTPTVSKTGEESWVCDNCLSQNKNED